MWDKKANAEKRRKLWITLISMSIVLAGTLAFLYWDDTKDLVSREQYLEDDTISFNKDSGWYRGNQEIELTINRNLPKDCEIHYTLNGNDPLLSDRIYDGSIQLKCKKDMQVYPLKAAVFHGTDRSSILERTYVLTSRQAPDINLPVISITTDGSNLYDYDTGIFVAGRTYDQNKEQGAEYIQGNYHQRDEEWLRDAHVLFIDEGGRIQWDKDVQVGVSGGTSSAFAEKSLKIKANEGDTLNLGFSKEKNSEPEINQYASLRLRSGSQDYKNGSNLKMALASRIADEAGFDGCTQSKRCVLFVNSIFQGIYDIQQNYSDSYLSHRYGLRDSTQIEKKKGNVGILVGEKRLRGAIDSGFDLQESREILESSVDVDQYLLYYAVEICMNNTDWPGNSFETWRYMGKYDPMNAYSDGRYRFLIYDVDLIFETEKSTQYFEGSNGGDTLYYMLTQKIRGSEPLFCAMMEAEYYRDRFVTVITNLLNTVCESSNLLRIIDEEHDRIAPAAQLLYDDRLKQQFEEQTENLKLAAIHRPEQINTLLENCFGYSDRYQLRLQAITGVNIRIENMELTNNEQYIGEYFSETSVMIHQETAPGYSFQYWKVNGNPVYGETLNLTPEMLHGQEVVSVEPVALKEEEPGLMIFSMSPKGDQDWVQLRNLGTRPVFMGDYYLSDNPDNPHKYNLPDKMVEAGETVTLYGRKSIYSYGGCVCNFSIRSYETVSLTKRDQLRDSVYVPYLEKDQIYHREESSGKWNTIHKEASDSDVTDRDHIVAYVSMNASYLTITYQDPASEYDQVLFVISKEGTGRKLWAKGTWSDIGYWWCATETPENWTDGFFTIDAYNGQQRISSLRKYIPSARHDDVLAMILPSTKEMKIRLRSDRAYEYVQFAVWGKFAGKNDIEWYEAESTAQDIWEVTIDLTEHGERDYYSVQCDAYCADGEKESLMTGVYY